MKGNGDLIITLEANKRMYCVWVLLILMCKLDIASARRLRENTVEDFVYAQCGAILRRHAYGP